jgi:hypothetical protein
VQNQLKAPSSRSMRNGEILMVKFVDKKATGDKEIYLIDSRCTANIVQVERLEKGTYIHYCFSQCFCLILGGGKKNICKPSSVVDHNRSMG